MTPETSAKVKELLRDAAARKSSGWRQVNHASPGGQDIPVLYSAIDIGRDDRFVVVGRDLRPLAAMQQRLINAQQSMERDYVRLRHAETRYRLLFQVSSEAVMIVDAGNNAILDANPAALALFDENGPQDLSSPTFVGHFDAGGAPVVERFWPMSACDRRDHSARVSPRADANAVSPRRCFVRRVLAVPGSAVVAGASGGGRVEGDLDAAEVFRRGARRRWS